jgi:hypothetical protein
MNRKTLLIAGLALAASHLQAQTTNSAHIKTVGDYMTAESNWLDWRHMPPVDYRKQQNLGKLPQTQYLGKLEETGTPRWTYGAKDRELGHQLLSTIAHFFTGSLGQGI